MTSYIIDEIRATVKCARTMNRLAIRYRRDGNTAEFHRKRRSALWFLDQAKQLKMLAIREETAA